MSENEKFPTDVLAKKNGTQGATDVKASGVEPKKPDTQGFNGIIVDNLQSEAMSILFTIETSPQGNTLITFFSKATVKTQDPDQRH